MQPAQTTMTRTRTPTESCTTLKLLHTSSAFHAAAVAKAARLGKATACLQRREALKLQNERADHADELDLAADDARRARAVEEGGQLARQHLGQQVEPPPARVRACERASAGASAEASASWCVHANRSL